MGPGTQIAQGPGTQGHTKPLTLTLTLKLMPGTINLTTLNLMPGTINLIFLTFGPCAPLRAHWPQGPQGPTLNL